MAKPRKAKMKDRTTGMSPDERIAEKKTEYVPLADAPGVKPSARPPEESYVPLGEMPGLEIPPPSVEPPPGRSIHQNISFTTGNVPLPIEMISIEDKLALLHKAGQARSDRENAASSGYTYSGGVLRIDRIGGRR